MPHRSTATYEQACTVLARRLRDRFFDVELAVLTRIREKAPIEENPDPLYLHGLRTAIRDAIEFTLNSIETTDSKNPPMPPSLIGQARLAALYGVPLGTVLRRYTLGAHQIGYLIAADTKENFGQFNGHLPRLLTEQAHLLEHVLQELEHEYMREPTQRPSSRDARLASLIKRRLAGEPIDTLELNYDLARHHIGLATDEREGMVQALKDLAKLLDGQLLRVSLPGGFIWAWIGTRSSIDRAQFERHLASLWPTRSALGLGEPGYGPSGWCLTIEQAREAHPFALQDRPTVWYSEVVLRAAIGRDSLARVSLHHFFSSLFENEQDGQKLRATLRAYFDAEQNVSCAATILGVKRHTVTNRLRSVERRLGRSISSCAAELDLAIRLEEGTNGGRCRGWREVPRADHA